MHTNTYKLHNTRVPVDKRVKDPFPEVIMAVNEWLHW